MGLVKKGVLGAGLVMLAFLLYKLDARETAALAFQVRWAFALILVQELGAHALNALGWRLAFRPADAGRFRFRDLLAYRVMGDGVNYLTPSATIAGEFARANLLSETAPLPVRVNGVVAAKATQAAGQVAFIALGLGWAVGEAVPALAPWARAARWFCALAGAGGVLLWLAARSRHVRDLAEAAHGMPGWRGWVSRMPADLLGFWADHPARLCASAGSFALGYAWNTGETWLIARSLGAPVGWTTALQIEVLSNVVDALLFMVPAKAGTQEAGKTLVFGLLGL
ncbi:hypothetical protein EPO15_16810, partial [bacterium]